MIGQSVGHYRVLAKLGEGGMGVVYRASDSRLGREVALKVLPAAMAEDRERMARFEREARTLAALNHPNIAAIYGIEAGALVMELVEGQTLDERGGLSADEARQIADALEAAHEKGIIHRDLKPANIKITPGGQIKLLDFGLAKAAEAVAATDVTRTLGTSLAGAVMGTPAYMSPEQARGAAVDHRTDIWAYGVVLYELTTGLKLFGGETVSDILAEVLKGEFSVEAAPEWVKPVLRRCLVRDVKKRLGWIGEARLLLEAPAPVVQRTPWALYAAVGALVCLSGFLWWRTPKTHEARTERYALTPEALFRDPLAPAAFLSPDGKRIAYAANGKLWIRDLAVETPRVIEEGTDALAACWSPDSAWLAFFAQGQLWKVPAAGGPAVAFAQSIGTSCTWASDGNSLYLSAGLEIGEVPAAGGQRTVRATNDSGGNASFHGLSMLPGPGKRMLLTRGQAPRIQVVNLETKEFRDLGINGATPVYAETGHLLYAKPSEAQGAEIWAVPFALASGTVTGAPFPVVRSGAGPSVSRDGTLVHTDPTQTQIVVRDRTGKQTGTLSSPQTNLVSFQLSPDGKRIAMSIGGEGNLDIWIQETDRPVKNRITTDKAQDVSPVWSPDGKWIAFSSERDGPNDVYKQLVDGSRTAVRVAKSPGQGRLTRSWSSDGRFVFVETRGTGSPFNIHYLVIDGDVKPYHAGPFDMRSPYPSPDGRYVAFQSTEPGVRQILVRPFPEGPGTWQVSSEIGFQPRWRRDGKEIYFNTPRMLMAAPVSTQPTFTVGRAVELFPLQEFTVTSNSVSRYEPLADGQFAVLEPAPLPEGKRAAIHVVHHWLGAVEQK